jgi:hypothetical protein
MCDLLCVFREAIICVAEDRWRRVGRLAVQSVTDGGRGTQAKGVLRLKGRIYTRHIPQVTPHTSTANQLSLAIDMEDER